MDDLLTDTQKEQKMVSTPTHIPLHPPQFPPQQFICIPIPLLQIE